MEKEFIQGFDGYNDVVKEIEVCKKYGIDYTLSKGSALQAVNRLHPTRLTLRVIDIFEETSSTKTLRLVSENNPLPPFQAGQYIALFLEIGGIKTTRPYSISSPPNQTGYYELTVRRVENGLASNYLLDNVKRGKILESSGPAGNFYYNPVFHDNTLVFIAGGSGITPFVSIIREVVECGLDRTIHLFYGNRNLDDAPFHEWFRDISDRHENIHYLPVIETPQDDYEGLTGFITGDIIKDALVDPSDKTFYLCGPQAMYDFCIPEIEKLGIPGRKIRKEMYGVPVNIFDDPGWPQDVKEDDLFTIKVRGSDSMQARAGEPLLVALEKNGIMVPSLCRSGECSMCRVKLLSGKVFQPAGVLLRESDRRYGYIHSCASYPLEDLEILI